MSKQAPRAQSAGDITIIKQQCKLKKQYLTLLVLSMLLFFPQVKCLEACMMRGSLTEVWNYKAAKSSTKTE